MNAIDNLKAVLCDPEGKCCIHGSDGDRRVVDDALRELAAAQAQRDKARNDALEEAAKICDEYANVGVVGARICAAAICATKGAHIKEMHEFIAENQRLINAALKECGK